MDLPNLDCPGCHKPLIVENSKDLIDYLCDEGCNMRNLPRHYLRNFGRAFPSAENLNLLLRVALETHRMIEVH